MKDPRERVETERLLCEDEQQGVYEIHGGWVPWSECVEFAEKILAADRAWKDANTPTIEELRTNYPAWGMRVGASASPGQFRVKAERHVNFGHPMGLDGFKSEPEALRWLAAKLAELEGA